MMTGIAIDRGFASEAGFVHIQHHGNHSPGSILCRLGVTGKVPTLSVPDMTILTVDPEGSFHEIHRGVKLRSGHALQRLNVLENLFDRLFRGWILRCAFDS